MTGALSILSTDAGLATEHSTAGSTGATSFALRGAWLLQAGSTLSSRICDPTDAKIRECQIEHAKVLLVLISLISTIVIVMCAFAFFREDKEEQITPLCPQLVVKDPYFDFRLPLPAQQEDVDEALDVTDADGNTIVKISMEWPDPFRQSGSAVALTVRLLDTRSTLATVVSRNVEVAGQGLALCRHGCEIFGFVEPITDHRYSVRHKTGIHLLTLAGDFGALDIDGINPVGSKVCSIQKANGSCVGRVAQHVDAGLVICAFMAAHIHRRLKFQGPPLPSLGALGGSTGFRPQIEEGEPSNAPHGERPAASDELASP